MVTSSNIVSIDRKMVRGSECLFCYLSRLLETVGCDHSLRLTMRWIEAQQRSARWIVKWAANQGGHCDCEVWLNAFRDDKQSARHRKLRCAASYAGAVSRCVGGEG
jgi:hypothetical protein